MKVRRLTANGLRFSVARLPLPVDRSRAVESGLRAAVDGQRDADSGKRITEHGSR